MNVKGIRQNTVNSALIQAQTKADSSIIATMEQKKMERLQTLREQIKAGTYLPTSEEIAKAIFRYSVSDK
jgi:anti-sigma28 factor (negative regulator of flagellin synthesis)